MPAGGQLEICVVMVRLRIGCHALPSCQMEQAGPLAESLSLVGHSRCSGLLKVLCLTVSFPCLCRAPFGLPEGVVPESVTGAECS